MCLRVMESEVMGVNLKIRLLRGAGGGALTKRKEKRGKERRKKERSSVKKSEIVDAFGWYIISQFDSSSIFIV